uniref:Secreted protein n=1 Tax=Octopus bimaculoides TaxID=37653 RepID=A0A0L8HS35_OCTBM
MNIYGNSFITFLRVLVINGLLSLLSERVAAYIPCFSRPVILSPSKSGSKIIKISLCIFYIQLKVRKNNSFSKSREKISCKNIVIARRFHRMVCRINFKTKKR